MKEWQKDCRTGCFSWWSFIILACLLSIYGYKTLEDFENIIIGLMMASFIFLIFLKESLFWQKVVISFKFHLYRKCKMWICFFGNLHTDVALSPDFHFSPTLSFFYVNPSLPPQCSVATGTCHHWWGLYVVVEKCCNKGRPWIYSGGMVCKWEIFLKMLFLMNSLVLSWLKKKWCQGGVSFSPKHFWSQCTNNVYIPVHREKKWNMKIFHWKLTALTNFKG